ncbi:MAG: hypothetical protein ACRYG7_50155 [Janthinobacterium lividum]
MKGSATSQSAAATPLWPVVQAKNFLQKQLDASPRIVAQRQAVARVSTAQRMPTEIAFAPETSKNAAHSAHRPIQRVRTKLGVRSKVHKTRSRTTKTQRMKAEVLAVNVVNGSRVRKGVNRYGRGDGTRYGVGSYATHSGVRTTNITRRFSPQEKNAVNRLGTTSGCHMCGTKVSGWPDSHWTPDHQPPLSRSNLANYRGALYPHCKRCSSHQGGVLAGMQH